MDEIIVLGRDGPHSLAMGLHGCLRSTRTQTEASSFKSRSLDGVELRNSSGYRESTRTKYVDRVAMTQSITEQLSAISGRPRLREYTKGYFPDMVMEGIWSYCPVSCKCCHHHTQRVMAQVMLQIIITFRSSLATWLSIM